MTVVQPADAQARQRTVCLVLCLAALGMLVILASERFLPILEAWVVRNPAKHAFRALIVLGAFCMLFVTPFIGFVVYLWRLGDVVVRTKRFPPPGIKVIRDTPVLQHRDAYRRGRLLQFLAVLLLLAIGIPPILILVVALP